VKKRSSSRVTRGAWTIGAISMLLAAVFLVSCGGGQGGQQGGGQQDAQNATLDEVTGSPQNFYGKTVTVTGAVGAYIEPRGLVLVPQELIGELRTRPTLPTPEGVPTPHLDPILLDQGVLVVSGVPLNTQKRDVVRVTGEVRRFDREAVREELGVNLRKRYYGGWRNKPAILAQSLEVVQGGGTTSPETTE
jgi:hypothetical protein